MLVGCPAPGPVGGHRVIWGAAPAEHVQLAHGFRGLAAAHLLRSAVDWICLLALAAFLRALPSSDCGSCIFTATSFSSLLSFGAAHGAEEAAPFWQPAAGRGRRAA